jgi:hypothetical protein
LYRINEAHRINKEMGNGVCGKAKPPEVEPVPRFLPPHIEWSGQFINQQMHGFGTETNSKTGLTGTGQYNNGFRIGRWEFWQDNQRDSIREYNPKTGEVQTLIVYVNNEPRQVLPVATPQPATEKTKEPTPEPVVAQISSGLDEFLA